MRKFVLSTSNNWRRLLVHWQEADGRKTPTPPTSVISCFIHQVTLQSGCFIDSHKIIIRQHLSQLTCLHPRSVLFFLLLLLLQLCCLFWVAVVLGAAATVAVTRHQAQGTKLLLLEWCYGCRSCFVVRLSNASPRLSSVIINNNQLIR